MRDREGRTVAEIDRDYSNGGVMLGIREYGDICFIIQL